MSHRFATSIACSALFTLLAQAAAAQGPGKQAGAGGGMCANRSAGASESGGVMQSIASVQSSGTLAPSNQIISQAYGIRGLGLRRGSSSSSQFRQMQNYQQNYFRQLQAQQLQAQQQEAQANAAMHDRLLKAADARRAAETKLRKINSAPATSSSDATPASTARANARAALHRGANANVAKPSTAAKPMTATK